MKIERFELAPTIGDGVRVRVHFDDNEVYTVELNKDEKVFHLIHKILKSHQNQSIELANLKKTKKKK